ncbi:MAG: hypothetical protein ACRDNE_10000, partial [Gaiellaceae bacterium]
MTPADCAPRKAGVHPGARDEPDVPGFRDTNCDGIDGDKARAIFLSPIGNDASPGTRAKPKRTMANAVATAAAQGKDVYATFGTYTERLGMANGVGVYGGYGLDWRRSLSNETRLTGAATAGRTEGAVAVGITTRTVLQHITLAPEAPSTPGASSYGVRALSSPGLVIDRVVATGGAGAPGLTGAAGVPGRPGGTGGNGGVDCNDTPGSGGAGGASPWGRSGGRGGNGGVGGQNGFDGAHGLLTTFDARGRTGGPGGDGGDGGDGAGVSGFWGDSGTIALDGSGGASGIVWLGLWLTGAGQAGAQGTHGHGGGGGGGGEGWGGAIQGHG